MPKISLSGGINSIASTKHAETKSAKIRILLLNIPVLKIDFLLFLILNTCTSSDKALFLDIQLYMSYLL